MTAEGVRNRHRCWTVLCASVWAALFLASNADAQGEDAECQVLIKVRRHTVYVASVGQNLRINCTVGFCNDLAPLVSWYKVDKHPVQLNISRNRNMEIQWTVEKHREGVSVLIFHNFLNSDSGLYQCKAGNGTVIGHIINVSISGDAVVLDNSSHRETNDTSNSFHGLTSLLMYMYCAAGIVGIVVIIITVSVLSMRGCKGKPKKEAETENQYMAIPMVEQHCPPQGLQSSPRGSPSAPPSGPSNSTKTPPSPVHRDNNHVLGKVQNDRELQRFRNEEGVGSLVYAALNHQQGAQRGCRPRAAEETSEYASIRVS